MKYLLNSLLVLLVMLLSSCQAIADIFKTGVGVGVILTVGVIIGIIALVIRIGRGRKE